jgi:hypothetical protein
VPRLLALLLAVSLLAGCGGGDAPPREPTRSTAAADDGDPCAAARPEKTVEAPEALDVPDGAEVEEVEPLPPNQKVAGFIPVTPSSFLKLYDRDRSVGILFREDEKRDAEIMVTDGKQRSFWKLTLACPKGSRFTVLTGEELAPGAARKAIRRHARELEG